MNFSRLVSSWESVALVSISVLVAYLLVVLYTRVAGPRSLATMSSFDFAATIAIGSTVATATNLATPLVHLGVALSLLYSFQWAASALRRRSGWGHAIDNDPLLLIAEGELLMDHLKTARMSERELWAQLRQAGFGSTEDVAVAVLETSGAVSVLRKGEALAPRVFEGVRGAQSLNISN